MALFYWNDTMVIGMEVIDKDHRTLVDLVNLLGEAVEDASSKEATMSALDSLYDYVNFHFAREERMLKACDYPDLKRHIKAHESLKARLNEIRADFKRRNTAKIDRYVLEYLKDWLKAHITGRDKLYQGCIGEHLKEAQQKS